MHESHALTSSTGAVIVFLVSAFDDDSAVAVYLFVSICVTSLVASLMLVRRDSGDTHLKQSVALVPQERTCSLAPHLISWACRTRRHTLLNDEKILRESWGSSSSMRERAEGSGWSSERGVGGGGASPGTPPMRAANGVASDWF